MSQTNQIIMYSTSWCPDCHRAKHFFDNYGVDYVDIDVEKELEAAEIVKKLNNGNRTVPTILFPDGSMLVEPSTQQLADKTGITL